MSHSSLGEVAKFINGYGFGPEDWHDEGLPIVRIANLTDPSKPYTRSRSTVPDRFHVRQGELLVSWSATLDVFEWQREEHGLVNQHIFRVIPDTSKVDQNYLKIIIRKALFDMERHMHGSTMKHVNRGEFLGAKIALPPLTEQRRMADILDRADALKRKRQQALQLADEFLRATFLDMFGDPKELASRPDCLTLAEVCSVITDGEHATPKRTESGFKLLSARNVHDGEIRLDTGLDYIPESELNRIYRRCGPQQGDLLISCSGSIGRVAPVETDERFGLVRSVALIRPKANLITTTYLEYWLRTDHMKRQMVKASKASSQANLFLGPIKALKCYVPPQDQQCRFQGIAKAVGECLARLSQAGQDGETLSASLQNRMFTTGGD